MEGQLCQAKYSKMSILFSVPLILSKYYPNFQLIYAEKANFSLSFACVQTVYFLMLFQSHSFSFDNLVTKFLSKVLFGIKSWMYVLHVPEFPYFMLYFDGFS